MKNILLSITFLFSLISFSQVNDTINSEKKSSPDSKNALSLYFKSEVPKSLLKVITYPKNKSNLTISFYVNNERKPFGITISSVRNTKLNSALKEAFEKYPLENFTTNFDTKKKYSFQVISKESDENIINCSSNLEVISAPNCASCIDLNFYTDIKKCISQKIRKYFFNSLDYSLANNASIQKETILINIKLYIDKEGILKLEEIKAPSIFEENIKESVKNYPDTFIPSSSDDSPINYGYNFSLQFKKGDTPTEKENDQNFDTIFKPTETNDFALYLSKNLTNEDVKNANLNRINDRFTLYFEMDKKGNPSAIRTNARSKNLEEKVVSLFKNYKLNKLNFIDKHIFNRYFTSIIIFEEGKNIIKTNSIIGYNRVPIFPGCKKSKNVSEVKKCFSRGVQMHFTRKFDADMPNRLGLAKGRKRVHIGFKINKKGKVVSIMVRAPHPTIKEEVIKVMRKLPKVKPAIFGHKTVGIKYSIPFTLIVD